MRTSEISNQQGGAKNAVTISHYGPTAEEPSPPARITQDKSFAITNGPISKAAVVEGCMPAPASIQLPTINQEATQEVFLTEITRLKSRLGRSETESARLREELHHEREERIRRDAEVESLRQYVMANDVSQGSEAVALIEGINNATLTFAAELSLNWDLEKDKGPFKGAGRQLSALEIALVQCHLNHSQARLLLQAAFRSSILDEVTGIMVQACYGMDEAFGGLIQNLEKFVRETESQPTFARWRAITYGALFSKLSDAQQHRAPGVCQAVVNNLHFLGMLLTGRHLDQSEFAELVRDTEEVMHDIISKTIQFARMVRIKIVSANYQHSLPTGTQFVEERMEMPHPLLEPAQGDLVAATVRLGLFRHEKVGRDGSRATEDLWSVPLKAQVLTQREVLAMSGDTKAHHEPILNRPTSQDISVRQIVTQSYGWAKRQFL